MVEDLMNRPCTVHMRAISGRDDYNNPERSSSQRETVCELQQVSRNELGGATEVSRTGWAAFFRSDEDLEHVDRIEVEGHLFEVIGAPNVVRNARTGELHHIELELELVEAELDGDDEEAGSGS